MYIYTDEGVTHIYFFIIYLKHFFNFGRVNLFKIFSDEMASFFYKFIDQVIIGFEVDKF